jgi:hypothetical protein
MKTTISQALSVFESQRLPGELVVYHKSALRDFWGRDLWLLTDQRLLLIRKGTVEEKLLFEPGEAIVSYETGEEQFSGNVHLLTSQRLLVLDTGARNYLLHSIPLGKIVEVDVTGVRDGSLNTIIYALKIKLVDGDDSLLIQHGGVSTGSINETLLEPQQRQQLNERFPRKICETVGLKFAFPRRRIGPNGLSLVDFYSKSDLTWPERCSACYVNTHALVYDTLSVENPWLAAEYHLGFGMIPNFSYQIPYCPDCFHKHLELEPVKQAVKAGSANSNGARVELCFENQEFAQEFIQTNNY